MRWEVIKRSQKYKIGDKECRLCLDEIIIILREGPSLLNERRETFSTCRHKRATSFINYKEAHAEDWERRPVTGNR